MTQADFASRAGINVNTLRNYERGDSLPNLEVAASICRHFGVHTDWLILGEGPMHRDEATPEAPQIVPAPQPVEEEWKMSDMLTKTAEVLESDTIYRTALASNINAFHQAVRSERLLAKLEERMATMEAKLERMGLLEERMADLERENAELKRRLERQDENTAKAVGD